MGEEEYMCTVCDRLLRPITVVGGSAVSADDESSLTGHSAIWHILCRSCHRYYTPQRYGIIIIHVIYAHLDLPVLLI